VCRAESVRTGGVVCHGDDAVALPRQFTTVERTNSHCHLHRRHAGDVTRHVT